MNDNLRALEAEYIRALDYLAIIRREYFASKDRPRFLYNELRLASRRYDDAFNKFRSYYDGFPA